jgi:hypothetical protein
MEDEIDSSCNNTISRNPTINSKALAKLTTKQFQCQHDHHRHPLDVGWHKEAGFTTLSKVIFILIINCQNLTSCRV